MPKFKVMIKYTLTNEVIVEAESGDDALENVSHYDYDPSESKIVDHEYVNSWLVGEVDRACG